MTVFANEYLNVCTTGFHYAFGVAILAMVLSLVIFLLQMASTAWCQAGMKTMGRKMKLLIYWRQKNIKTD